MALGWSRRAGGEGYGPEMGKSVVRVQKGIVGFHIAPDDDNRGAIEAQGGSLPRGLRRGKGAKEGGVRIVRDKGRRIGGEVNREGEDEEV